MSDLNLVPLHLYRVKNEQEARLTFCAAGNAQEAAAKANAQAPDMVETKEMSHNDMRLTFGPLGANLVIHSICSNWRLDNGLVVFPDSALGTGIVHRTIKRNA